MDGLSPGLEDTVSAISGNFRKLPEIAGNLPEIAGNCWRPGGGGASNFRKFPPEISGNFRKLPEITPHCISGQNWRKFPELLEIAGNCGNFRKLPATPALPDPFSTRTCPFFRPAPFSGPLFPPTPDRDFCRLPEGGVPQLPCGLSKFRN